MPELDKTILKNSANLKFYARFEGNSNDSSASGLNGTDTAITYGTSYGNFGQGALFTPASNSSISLGTSNTLNLTGNFSINCWIKPTALNAYQIIFRRGSSYGFQFEINNANNTFFFNARGGNTATAPTNSLTAGVWQMITMTKSSTNVTLWVNGKFLNTTASITVTSDPGQTAYLGHNGSNTEEYDGALDDLAIFDTALSADQIKELYEGRYLGELRPGQYGTTAALYHLSSTTDAGGNNYHLTNNNTVAFNPGKFGTCADFSATNSNKSLSYAGDLGITGGNCSFNVWVKMQAEIGSSSWGIIAQQDGGTRVGNSIWYDYNSGTRRLIFRRGKNYVANQDFTHTITLGTTLWYMLTYVYDGTNINGYLNGNLLGTPVAASGNGTTNGTDAFSIGALCTTDTGALSNFASALIDEVQVSSTALTANQIRQIYALGVGKYF